MPIVNTGLLEAGLRADFFNAYNAIMPLWPRFTRIIPSTLPAEKFRWLGQVPSMRTWEGARQMQGLNKEAYDIENEEYEASIEVLANEIDDDQLGQIRERINDLVPAAATHRDYLRAQLLENGGNAGYNSYDGVTFFNAAHVFGQSGNLDNDTTSAAATGTDPTTAEMKAAIQLTLGQLSSFKDDQGRPANIGRAGVIVEVPPGMEFAAREALNAAIIASTSNVLVGAAEVLVNSWLTSADRFYTSITGGQRKPFVCLERRRLEFRAVDERDPQAAFNRRYKYGVDARYKLAYGDPLTCVRHVFT